MACTFLYYRVNAYQGVYKPNNFIVADDGIALAGIGLVVNLHITVLRF